VLGFIVGAVVLAGVKVISGFRATAVKSPAIMQNRSASSMVKQFLPDDGLKNGIVGQ
jgi:hypothetical protein